MRVNFIRSLLIELSVISDIDVATMVVRGVIGGSVVHCSQQPRQVRRGPPLRGRGGVGLSKVAELFDFSKPSQPEYQFDSFGKIL